MKRVRQAGIGSPFRAPVVNSPETPAPRPRGAPYLHQGRWAGTVSTPPFSGQAPLRDVLQRLSRIDWIGLYRTESQR